MLNVFFIDTHSFTCAIMYYIVVDSHFELRKISEENKRQKELMMKLRWTVDQAQPMIFMIRRVVQDDFLFAPLRTNTTPRIANTGIYFLRFSENTFETFLSITSLFLSPLISSIFPSLSSF